jgi:plastocyanin
MKLSQIVSIVTLTLVVLVLLFVLKPEGNDSLPGTVGNLPDGTHVITLTKEGFSPSKITIKLGERVTFNTTEGELFWPASNLHPSHLIYAEFDPKKPLQPNEVWSFTFTKAGEWQFHDHLSPYFTGVITVTE